MLFKIKMFKLLLTIIIYILALLGLYVLVLLLISKRGYKISVQFLNKLKYYQIYLIPKLYIRHRYKVINIIYTLYTCDNI